MTKSEKLHYARRHERTGSKDWRMCGSQRIRGILHHQRQFTGIKSFCSPTHFGCEFQDITGEQNRAFSKRINRSRRKLRCTNSTPSIIT